MRDSLKSKQSSSPDSARSLAVSALAFIGADPDRLSRFLGLTGLGPHNLRSAAADPAFLDSVLDYVVADEELLYWLTDEDVRALEANYEVAIEWSAAGPGYFDAVFRPRTAAEAVVAPTETAAMERAPSPALASADLSTYANRPTFLRSCK